MSKRKVDPIKVGKRIRELRGEMPQEKFHKLVGIKRQGRLSVYENGRVPKHQILVNIADYCGVSIDWLLTGEEARKQPQQEKVA